MAWKTIELGFERCFPFGTRNFNSNQSIDFSFKCSFQQGVRARFKFYLEDEVATKAIDNTSNPDWSFKKQFNFTPVTSAVIIADHFLFYFLFVKF